MGVPHGRLGYTFTKEDCPMSEESTRTENQQEPDMFLFWGCFVALIATAFGFILRALIIGDWQADFALTETQKGELLGVGLWPFAISIVLFSLVIDRIGYGTAMVFAFVCHIVSAVVTIATPWIAGEGEAANETAYWCLYIGTFIVALGNGTVEAVINPVVATMFHQGKTKWLNILHAGWPGGLVLGGLLALILLPESPWEYKVALIFLPTIAYGVMLFGRKFPIHERVAAGVSYKAMLSQVGFCGALIITALMVWEVTRVLEARELIFQGASLEFKTAVRSVCSLVIAGAFGLYVQSLGRPLFIFLLLIMMPVAITELGTDSWISDLMRSVMQQDLGVDGGWVLIYSAFLMMILRFFCGPIVEKLGPIGLLVVSSVLAIAGLVFLSQAAGLVILVAATVYAFGKSFFWPTMLGVVAEQFPRGGALTINTIAGVGMLCVGILGNPLLGFIQDQAIETGIVEYDEAEGTEYGPTYVTQEKVSLFYEYRALDQAMLEQAPEEDQEVLDQITSEVKKETLFTIAILPTIMLVCYLILMVYFRSKGGYKTVHIHEEHG